MFYLNASPNYELHKVANILRFQLYSAHYNMNSSMTSVSAINLKISVTIVGELLISHTTVN